MTITERAQKVLAEIDAALALAEKATPGPWYHVDSLCAEGPDEIRQTMSGVYVGSLPMPEDCRLIATSRNGYPLALRCLKTAIYALLQCLESGTNIEKIRWGNDGDCGASNHATDITYSADTALTSILDQWEASR